MALIHLQGFADAAEAAGMQAEDGNAAAETQPQTDAPAAESPEAGGEAPAQAAEKPAEAEAEDPAGPSPQTAAPDEPSSRAMRETLLVRLRGARARQIAERWAAEAQALKKIYPDFDLRTALRGNPDFAALVRAGLPLQRAYEAANLEEILTSALRYAAVRGGRRAADALREAPRPQENSVLDRASSLRTTDVNSLTQKDILRIIGEVNRGAKITFR